MTENKKRKKILMTSIFPAILAGMKQEEVQNHIQKLILYFKDKYTLIIPKTITDSRQLLWLLNLNNNLSQLEECEGFAKHLDEYVNNKVSAYFVSVVASSIVRKVDKLILEPDIQGRRNKSDMKFLLDNEEIYIECKCPELNPKFNKLEEHQHMFNVISPYITHPHQVSITYKEVFSDHELHKLGEELKRLLPSVTSDGAIIHNEKLEVQIIWQDDFLDPSLHGYMSGHLKSSQEVFPMDHFFSKGKRISLAGPTVDYKSVLLKQIKRSSQQASTDHPFILAVSSNHMVGRLSDNAKTVNAAFQPGINTRFNGVILVEYSASLTKIYSTPEFNFISNPYAQNPLSKRMVSTLFPSVTS